jgi:pimeloyl-ACP methyl ester carboxylesterase
MKKGNFLLSAMTGVGISVAMLGCGGDGVNEPLDEIVGQEAPARMVAVYAPSTGSLPIPNDLLFSGSTDLTLNLPVADATNFADPTVAISALDGWSSVAPFSIDFSSRDANLSLDESTVIGGTNIHFYKVNVLRPEVAPGIPAPTGPVTSVERELTAGLEYVVQMTGPTSVAIIPTAPLEQQSAYMVVLTNGLQDTDGLPLLHDAQYAIAQSTTPISQEVPEGALEPVRQLVNAMEIAAAAFEGGPARSEIIMSYQFMVQSVGTVLNSAKLAYIDGPLAGGAVPAMTFSTLGTDTTPFTGLGAADLYKGSIALTYLLGAPSEENPTAPLNVMWKALEELPIGPEGALVPNPFGENLTYANSFPRANGVEVAPLLVSMPKAGICPKPAAGYPVVIFQHGITANRTNLLGIADSLAAAPSCTAAVAMDMPLHGITAEDPVHLGLQAASGGLVGLFEGYDAGALRERTMGVDYIDNATGAPGPDGVADSSGAHTINLANLLVSRDNNRQAILDLLYLEKAIGFMDIDGGGVDFDTANLSFIGHSLGGIVGSSFVAYSDMLKAAALANPGGGIGQLLNGSDTFGPRIRAGVAAAAGMTVEDPAFAATLNSFLVAAQTVVDSSDPINTATFAVTNNVPTLLLQVANDAVVPNSVATGPLSGTIPLSRALGTTTLVAEEPGVVAGSRIFTKLNQGLHSTVLSPADASGDPIGLLNVTTEMQTQIVSFFLTNGTAVQVTDPTLLAE